MCHVLIIEDEPLIAIYLQDFLRDHGATSFAFAATEDEAVLAARVRPPAFITSDVHLREGVGPQAVRRIVAELGPVPTLFITATPEALTAPMPAARVLGKPADGAAIAQAFRDMAPL